ncbi:dTDP-4-dehydrorhamnose reductase [uncultured Algibacter sp.]|uniref:dTDP-4-dehydrorhamnose reductase n=1 Tax=uncultured Algibacter sp. TaxID=298659 RepID=UPI0026346306|nr:dTDP-4-dehydrorhamnose reductase [uncultured Algibacter sp.]
MINVLVTGSNGQLASCIKDLENKYSDLNFIYTDYLELDITNKEDVTSFFKQHSKIDYCINCAAYTAVDKAENDIEKAFAVNAIGPKNLVLVCSEYDTVLIHVSTDFVFDGMQSFPYIEKNIANPISIYGKSKLQGEKEITSNLGKYFIFRTSWLYSEYGNNFMKTMLSLAETRDEISVVSDQIGTPTYAKDLAAVILKVILEGNSFYGVYHYSNEGVASWYDFAKAIFDSQNISIKVNPIKTEFFPTPAKRPMYSVMEKTKIKDKIGLEIPYWKDSLKEATYNYCG